MANIYFKVKILKYTMILFGNEYCTPWYDKMVGKTILVKNVDWISAYYEAKNGLSVLQTDCHAIAKTPVR